MPYIGRNDQGEIVAMGREETAQTSEYVADNHPDLQKFIDNASPRVLRQLLLQTDQDMITAIDEVLSLLIRKNILKVTDLSETLQRRVFNRRKLRLMIEETEQAGKKKTSTK